MSSITNTRLGAARHPGVSLRLRTLALVLVALLATACGSPTTSSEPSAKTSAAQTTQVPATQAPASSAPSPASSAATSPTTPKVDPRTITGPAHVDLANRLAPVASNPKQTMPVSFTDNTGKKLQITDASRVLMLDIYGTYSQIVTGLGLAKVLVGRTASDDDPALASLPVVTQNGHSLNAEAILKLAPRLVVTDTTLGPSEVIEQLKASGITVVTLDSKRTLETVGPTINQIATILGVPAEGKKLADATAKDITDASNEIAQMAPSKPLRTAVLYVRGTAGVFFIFGKGYGTDALIKGLHAEDVAAENGITDIKPANAEALVQLNPEVIIVMTKGLASTGGLDGLLKRPGITQTSAGANKRVIDIEDGLLLSFGPNTGNVMRALARAMYTKA